MPKDMAGAIPFHDLDIHLPICSFKLEAFDTFLLLERAVFQLRSLLRRISDDMREHIHSGVREVADTAGVSKDDLLLPASGYIAVRMDMGFNVHNEADPPPESTQRFGLG
ncbi:MAG: hypothetical protein QM690_05890 [Sphingobium sp.]